MAVGRYITESVNLSKLQAVFVISDGVDIIIPMTKQCFVSVHRK